jgi:hypothetical protein
VDGLKDALTKTGSVGVTFHDSLLIYNTSARPLVEGQSVSVSLNLVSHILISANISLDVGHSAKERHAYGMDDDSKFDQPWRRDGPLPDLQERDGHRRRQDGSASQPGVADNASDWRSGRTRFAEADAPHRRKASGFSPQEGTADKEDVWTIGGKFKPSAPSEESTGRFGSLRARSEGTDTDTDWRGAARPRGGPSNTSRALFMNLIWDVEC